MRTRVRELYGVKGRTSTSNISKTVREQDSILYGFVERVNGYQMRQNLHPVAATVYELRGLKIDTFFALCSKTTNTIFFKLAQMTAKYAPKF
jgi:hypothetical protein